MSIKKKTDAGGLLTTTILTANISGLIKKTDYDTKIGEI